jgi:hypothetical protein
MPVGDLADFADWVDGSAIDIADLGANDSRPTPLLERGGQRCRQHPALVVGLNLDNGIHTGAQEAQCPVDRSVAPLASDDAYFRRSP